ncbi:MAG TPA: hypothetical protein PK659_11100, partial [Methanothrix sp.]
MDQSIDVSTLIYVVSDKQMINIAGYLSNTFYCIGNIKLFCKRILKQCIGIIDAVELLLQQMINIAGYLSNTFYCIG